MLEIEEVKSFLMNEKNVAKFIGAMSLGANLGRILHPGNSGNIAAADATPDLLSKMFPEVFSNSIKDDKTLKKFDLYLTKHPDFAIEIKKTKGREIIAKSISYSKKFSGGQKVVRPTDLQILYSEEDDEVLFLYVGDSDLNRLIAQDQTMSKFIPKYLIDNGADLFARICAENKGDFIRMTNEPFEEFKKVLGDRNNKNNDEIIEIGCEYVDKYTSNLVNVNTQIGHFTLGLVPKRFSKKRDLPLFQQLDRGLITVEDIKSQQQLTDLEFEYLLGVYNHKHKETCVGELCDTLS